MKRKDFYDKLEYAQINPLQYLFDFICYEDNTLDTPVEVTAGEYLALVEHPLIWDISKKRGFLLNKGNLALLEAEIIPAIYVFAYEVHWKIN